MVRSLNGVDYTRGTGAASPLAPSGDAFRNFFDGRGLTAATTISAPSGTALVGNTLLIVLTDNGTARALTWNAAYTLLSGLTLPTTTVVGKEHLIGFIYTGANWRLSSVGVSP